MVVSGLTLPLYPRAAREAKENHGEVTGDESPHSVLSSSAVRKKEGGIVPILVDGEWVGLYDKHATIE